MDFFVFDIQAFGYGVYRCGCLCVDPVRFMEEQFSDLGSPRCLSGKDSACQCKRRKKQGFNPWVGKIPLEEGIATRSSFLAWKIPWTEEPGRLWFIGSQRVEHD